MTRHIAFATLAVVVVAGIGTAGCGRNRSPDAQPASPSPTATITASPAKRVDVRNTTLTLPDPKFAKACGKGGSLTFVDGAAKVGAATWKIGEMTPIEGDLDGVSGAELVTTLSCSLDAYLQLVALAAAPSGELSVLGYVLPPDAEMMFDTANVRIEAGVVQVTPTGTAGHVGLRCYPKQVRGYSYRDGTFKQTSGPTTFPEPPLDVREIDLRNAALALSVPGASNGTLQFACVSMNEGTGSGTLFRADPSTGSAYTFTIKPISIATGEGREFAIALVTFRAGAGPEVQSVQAIHRGTDGFEGLIFLRTGVDGVTSIDAVKVDGGRVNVTVTVNGTKQTRTYTEKPPGSDVWRRA